MNHEQPIEMDSEEEREKQSFSSLWSSTPALLDKTLPLLLQSGYLDLRSFVIVHEVLKKKCNWLDFVSSSSPLPNGEARFDQWKRMVICRPNTANPDCYLRKYDRERACGIAESNQDDDLREVYRKTIESVDISQLTRFSSGVEGEIMRDVVRSYQTLPLFQEHCIGREMLTRVLVAIAKSCKEVGYCQGMNFVVGALIIGRLPEELVQDPLAYDSERFFSLEVDVYSLTRALIPSHSRFAMQGLWGERIPRLKLRVYQLDRLLRWYTPRLHAHFTTLSLNPEVLTAQWFITLFAYVFPVETLLRLWDYIFLAGWEGIFRIAVSILSLLQPTLLALEDMEGVAMLLKEWRRVGHLPSLHTEQLFRTARELLISEEVLLRLQESYAHELLSLVDVCVSLCAEVCESESESETETEKSCESEGEESVIALTHTHTHAHTHSHALTSPHRESESSVTETERDPTQRKKPSLTEAEKSQKRLEKIEKLKKKREKQEKRELNWRRKLASASHSANTQASAGTRSPMKRDGEAPTNWLLRYGQRLRGRTVRELSALNEELQRLDEQIDRDKQQIQSKILRVCDAHREAQERLSDAIQCLHTAQIQYLQSESSLNSLTQEAHALTESTRTFIDKFDAHAKETGPVRARLIQRCIAIVREKHEKLHSVLTHSHTHSHTQSNTHTEAHTLTRTHSHDTKSEVSVSVNESDSSFVHTARDTHTHATTTRTETNTEEEGEEEEEEEILFSPASLLSDSRAHTQTHAHTDTHTAQRAFSASFDSEDPLPRLSLSSPHSPQSPTRTCTHSMPASQTEQTPLSPSLSGPAALLRRAKRIFLLDTNTNTNTSADANAEIDTPTQRETFFESESGRASLFGSFSLSERATTSLLSLSPLHTNGRVSSVKGAIHLHALEAATQQTQQKLISATLRKEEAHKLLVLRRNELEEARLLEEELAESKKSLCDQLQLLVEDSNRGRSQKLLFVTEHYVL